MFGFLLGAFILAPLLFGRKKDTGEGSPAETDTGSGATTGGYSFNSKGAALGQQVIYGQQKVGGAVVFDEVSGAGSEYLSRIVAFAGHPVEDFVDIYLDNYKVTTLDANGNVSQVQEVDEKGNLIGATSTIYDGLVSIRKVDGSHTASLGGTAFSNFSSNWTANHKLQGIAHLAVTFKYDEDAFPSGLPTITSLVKGKKVYDPRPITSGSFVVSTTYTILSAGTTDFTLIGAADSNVGTTFVATGVGTGTGTAAATEWSENPALCLRDYLTDTVYGLGEAATAVDDTAISTSANVCEEVLATALVSRYTCNGAFLTSKAPTDIIEDLTGSMAGTTWYAQGQWRVKAGKYVAPTVTLTEDDLRGPLSVSTRHSRRDNFNGVRGIFRGPETNYQPTEYPLVTDAAFVATDGGQESIVDFPTPFTNDSDSAQRLANILLERVRSQVTVVADFGLNAFKVQVGDIVSLTNSRLGFSSKPFEVSGWEFTLGPDMDFTVNLTLREITSTTYDEFTDATVFETDNTTLPNPFDNTTITSGLTVTESGQLKSDGTFFLLADISWTAPSNPFITRYEIQYKPVSASVYSSMFVTATEGQIGPIVEGISYDVRVRSLSNSGVKGSFAADTFTGGGDTTAPAAPTALSASGGFRSIRLTWTNPSDSDLKHVEVWEHTSNNSASASKVAEIDGDTFVREKLGTGVTRYYWLKAVDYSGNTSGFSSVASGSTESASLANGELATNSVSTVKVQNEAVSDGGSAYSTSTTTITGIVTYISLASVTFTGTGENALINFSFNVKPPAGYMDSDAAMDYRVTKGGTVIFDAQDIGMGPSGGAFGGSIVTSATASSTTYTLEARRSSAYTPSSVSVTPKSLSIREFKK